MSGTNTLNNLFLQQQNSLERKPHKTESQTSKSVFYPFILVNPERKT